MRFSTSKSITQAIQHNLDYCTREFQSVQSSIDIYQSSPMKNNRKKQQQNNQKQKRHSKLILITVPGIFGAARAQSIFLNRLPQKQQKKTTTTENKETIQHNISQSAHQRCRREYHRGEERPNPPYLMEHQPHQTGTTRRRRYPKPMDQLEKKREPTSPSPSAGAVDEQGSRSPPHRRPEDGRNCRLSLSPRGESRAVRALRPSFWYIYCKAVCRR